MKSKKIKWLVLIVVIVVAGVGYYIFAAKAQELAEQKFGESLHKVGVTYSKLDCKGLYSMKCVLSKVSFANGIKAEKIVYKNVQQFAKVSEGKSTKVDLDISITGVDASSMASKKYAQLASIMYGRSFQNSDYDKINEIAGLLLKGDAHISGDAEFVDKKIKNFKNLSFDYSNKILPLKLITSGHIKSSIKQESLSNLFYSKIRLNLDFKNLKNSYKKISRIILANKNITDAQLDERWDSFIKDSIANMEKAKKVEHDKFNLQGINSVENVLKGNNNMIKFLFKTKDNKGVSAANIFKHYINGVNDLLKIADIKIEN